MSLRLSATQIALCVLATAGVVGGAVTGVMVAAGLLAGEPVPADAVVRHAVPVLQRSEAGAAAAARSALRFPTPAAARSPRPHRPARAHPAHRATAATTTRAPRPVVHAAAPEPTIRTTSTVQQRPTATPTTATTPPPTTRTRDTAAPVSTPAPVTRPAPVAEPQPLAVKRSPAPDPAAGAPAPKPTPDPQPTGSFDDSG